jgi:hypothetical protein
VVKKNVQQEAGGLKIRPLLVQLLIADGVVVRLLRLNGC